MKKLFLYRVFIFQGFTVLILMVGVNNSRSTKTNISIRFWYIIFFKKNYFVVIIKDKRNLQKQTLGWKFPKTIPFFLFGPFSLVEEWHIGPYYSSFFNHSYFLYITMILMFEFYCWRVTWILTLKKKFILYR